MKTRMTIMNESVTEERLHAPIQTLTSYLDLWLNAAKQLKNISIIIENNYLFSKILSPEKQIQVLKN